MTDERNIGGGASRSTDPASGTSAATDVSLREFIALGADWQWRFMQERDRRYAEVQIEKDKALQLARDYQTYKDMQANELREQLARERIGYASKTDLQNAIETITATLKPIVEYVAGQQGAKSGALDQRQLVAWGFGVVAVVVAVYLGFN